MFKSVLLFALTLVSFASAKAQFVPTEDQLLNDMRNRGFSESDINRNIMSAGSSTWLGKVAISWGAIKITSVNPNTHLMLLRFYNGTSKTVCVRTRGATSFHNQNHRNIKVSPNQHFPFFVHSKDYPPDLADIRTAKFYVWPLELRNPGNTNCDVSKPDDLQNFLNVAPQNGTIFAPSDAKADLGIQ